MSTEDEAEEEVGRGEGVGLIYTIEGFLFSFMDFKIPALALLSSPLERLTLQRIKTRKKTQNILCKLKNKAHFSATLWIKFRTQIPLLLSRVTSRLVAGEFDIPIYRRLIL